MAEEVIIPEGEEAVPGGELESGTPPEEETPGGEKAGEVTPTPEEEQVETDDGITPEAGKLSEKGQAKVNAKINKLVREKSTEKERGDRLERELKEAKGETVTEDPYAFTKSKPNIDNFEDMADYQEALTDWKLDARDHENTVRNDRVNAETTREENIATFEERADILRGSNKDFDKVAKNPEVMKHYNQNMVDLFYASEKGPDVALFLGNNPTEAARIGTMPTAQQGIEFGKIVATMSQPLASKNISKAPQPINPGGGGGDVTPKRDHDEESMDEWMAREDAEDRKRYGG
jgi:hypothetical protein